MHWAIPLVLLIVVAILFVLFFVMRKKKQDEEMAILRAYGRGNSPLDVFHNGQRLGSLNFGNDYSTQSMSIPRDMMGALDFRNMGMNALDVTSMEVDDYNLFDKLYDSTVIPKYRRCIDDTLEPGKLYVWNKADADCTPTEVPLPNTVYLRGKAIRHSPIEVTISVNGDSNYVKTIFSSDTETFVHNFVLADAIDTLSLGVQQDRGEDVNGSLVIEELRIDDTNLFPKLINTSIPENRRRCMESGVEIEAGQSLFWDREGPNCTPTEVPLPNVIIVEGSFPTGDLLFTAEDEFGDTATVNIKVSPTEGNLGIQIDFGTGQFFLSNENFGETNGTLRADIVKVLIDLDLRGSSYTLSKYDVGVHDALPQLYNPDVRPELRRCILGTVNDTTLMWSIDAPICVPESEVPIPKLRDQLTIQGRMVSGEGGTLYVFANKEPNRDTPPEEAVYSKTVSSATPAFRDIVDLYRSDIEIEELYVYIDGDAIIQFEEFELTQSEDEVPATPWGPGTPEEPEEPETPDEGFWY